MQLLKKIVLAAAMALFVGLGTQFASAQAVSIAVVNISKVSLSLDAKKTADAEMEVLSKKLNEERLAKEAEIEKLKQEIQSYKPDSEPFKEAQEKMLRKALESEGFRQYAQEKILMEQRLRTMAMYRTIDKAVADFAKANNILLVLVADEPNLEGSRNQQELLSKITIRKVMFADERLDITSRIIEKINAEARTAPGK